MLMIPYQRWYELRAMRDRGMTTLSAIYRIDRCGAEDTNLDGSHCYQIVRQSLNI
jgi:hypothetical protein